MTVLAFLMATAALFMQSILSYKTILLVYAPFLTLITLLHSPPKNLYLAAFAGALLDLLSNDPLGIHAINYALSVWIMIRCKHFFHYARPLHFALLTYMLSFVSTLLQLFLLFLFDRRAPCSGKWMLGDFLLMPGLDAIYSLLCFSFPLLLYMKLQHRWGTYWHHIKRKLFQN